MAPPRAAWALPGGRKVDRYELVARLETGGMAEVFVARYRGAAGFTKNVAVKRILPHLAHDEEFLAMFLDEARIVSRISHPNVCQVFDFCESEDTYILAMEYLEGVTVKDLSARALRAEQPIEPRLAIGLVMQACEGLHAAHELRDEQAQLAGVVHRDVSPANLFVTVDGAVKVLDFGIAKAQWVSGRTKTGIRKGKAAYMSPEQAKGLPLDRRSDVFALGVVAWELLAAKRLFWRDNDYASLRAIILEPIPSLAAVTHGLPPAVIDVVMGALQRDRAPRHGSARAFQEALATAALELGGAAPAAELAGFVQRTFGAVIEQRRAVIAAAEREVSQVIEVVRGGGSFSEPSGALVAAPGPVPTTQRLAGEPPGLRLFAARPNDSEEVSAATTGVYATELDGPDLGALAPTGDSVVDALPMLSPALLDPGEETAAGPVGPRPVVAASVAAVAPAVAAAIEEPSVAAPSVAEPSLTAPVEVTGSLDFAPLRTPRPWPWIVAAAGSIALGVVAMSWLHRGGASPAVSGADGARHTAVTATAASAPAASSAPAPASPAVRPPALSAESLAVTPATSPAPALAALTDDRDRNRHKKEYGYLTVFSLPDEAVIYVDGKKIDDAPLVKLKLTSGHHRVAAVTKAGGRRQEHGVKIKKGELARLPFHWD